VAVRADWIHLNANKPLTLSHLRATLASSKGSPYQHSISETQTGTPVEYGAMDITACRVCGFDSRPLLLQRPRPATILGTRRGFCFLGDPSLNGFTPKIQSKANQVDLGSALVHLTHMIRNRPSPVSPGGHQAKPRLTQGCTHTPRGTDTPTNECGSSRTA
jgi:hypothetical protein